MLTLLMLLRRQRMRRGVGLAVASRRCWAHEAEADDAVGAGVAIGKEELVGDLDVVRVGLGRGEAAVQARLVVAERENAGTGSFQLNLASVDDGEELLDALVVEV